ncbi:MAG: potassium channel family protein, partial [Pseudodonghicola sp.]
ILSYNLLGDLRRDSRFFRLQEDAVIAAINLVVFIFTTASAAYVMFFDQHPGLGAYIDALYFTVATLTTTGFGDITLASAVGKLFSIFVMVFGVALFVSLARALFQPQKVRFTCPDCGLLRHDPDAVHCKHCGRLLNIPTEGAD